MSSWIGTGLFVITAAFAGVAGFQKAGAPQKRAASLEVVLHDVDERHRADVEAIVNKAVGRAEEVLGRKRDRKFELVVNLYAKEADYLDASRRLSGGAFDRNLAFANWDTMTAHVLFQPAMSAEVEELLGVPLQTRILLAHEATHLVRYAALPNHRHNPDWFADGLGQLVASDVTRGERAAADDPWESNTHMLVLDLARDGRLPTLEDVVKGRDASLGFNERYSLRQTVAQFLRDELGERVWKQVCEAIARADGGTDTSEPVLKVLARHEELEERFERWVLAFEPRWREVGRSAWWIESGLVQVGWPDNHAHLLLEQPLPTGVFEVRCRATVLPGAKRQMNLRFEREGGGFYQAALVAGYGLDGFCHDPEDGWIGLGGERESSLKLNEPFEISVKLEDGELVARFGATGVSRLKLEHGPIAGRLALSAQNGAAGIWHSVEVLDAAGEVVKIVP